jgi:L-threonylcarbamoyladenylate synthase
MKVVLPPVTTLVTNDIQIASEIICGGGLVAMPTETVYGLAGDATCDQAVAKIFAAKNRPTFNPLIIHVASSSAAQKFAVWNDRAQKLAAQFWPGPITMVLPQQSNSPISKLASAGLSTIAIRVPSHPLALQLLQACGKPLAAPSANKSGDISPTDPRHVQKSLGGSIDAILDGGACAIGLESTVIDLTSGQSVILRLGGLPIDAIRQCIGDVAKFDQSADQPIKSPGQLLRHYAPSIPLRIGCDNPQPNEALLAFGPDVPDGFKAVLNLSVGADLIAAAANLYKFLHQLDDAQYSGIATMPIPQSGLGLAINDRLSRAARGRS